MTAPSTTCRNPKSSRWGGGVTADEMRKMQWVRPELVAQVGFVEWTAEGRLRHAAFPGAALGQERAGGAAGTERGHCVTVSVRPRAVTQMRVQTIVPWCLSTMGPWLERPGCNSDNLSRTYEWSTATPSPGAASLLIATCVGAIRRRG
jgi:hypothetical protein